MNKCNYKIIAFVGPIGSGKTTACDWFHANYPQCYVYNFAAPIKSAVAMMFGFSGHQCNDTHEKEKVDERVGFSPRKAMQLLGTEIGRQLNPDIWVIRMNDILESIKVTQLVTSSNDNIIMVIGDMRFENEAAWVRKNNGLVVHILGCDTNRSQEHSSEKGIDMFGDVDYYLWNDAGLTEYKARLKFLADYCGLE